MLRVKCTTYNWSYCCCWKSVSLYVEIVLVLSVQFLDMKLNPIAERTVKHTNKMTLYCKQCEGPATLLQGG